MSDFVIQYPGSKRKEYYLFNDKIRFEDKNIFIEPFCGSGSMSFNISKDKGLEGNIFILNDIDPILIGIMNALKSLTFENFEQNVNEWRIKMLTKDTYNQLKKDEKTNIWVYFILHKYYFIHPGIFPSEKDILNTPYKLTSKNKDFINFIKSPNVLIKNTNWVEIFEEYKNNQKALILFDPPYIHSCNGYYEMSGNSIPTNVYEYFFENQNVTYQAGIYFILEKNWIISLLFHGRVQHHYNKQYGGSKRKTVHILIEW